MPLPKSRYASLRTLFEPHGGENRRQVLDASAVVLFFPGPNTVTGEDVLEFHVHGGPAVVKAVLGAISRSLPSLEHGPAPVRYAEPGEFTRRAFYNDRLSVTQIEALGDVLTAETEQQRQLAVRGSSAALSARYETWRRQLLYARGELEALIDFSEDQHFEESPEKLIASAASQIDVLRTRVQSNIQNAARGELLRNGISIALLGSPNAGKSSLLNRVVGREAAIVSQEAGTTRDVVDVNVDIGGFFCKLGDLAGLRGSSNQTRLDRTDVQPVGEIEQEGMRRARDRVFEADVVIVVLPVEELYNGFEVRVSRDVRETLEKCDLGRQKILLVVNKIDLVAKNAQLDDGAARDLLAFVFSHADQLDAAQPELIKISCLDPTVDSQASGRPKTEFRSCSKRSNRPFKP